MTGQQHAAAPPVPAEVGAAAAPPVPAEDVGETAA